MHAEVYTDGIEEITVGGSIVRIDFISLSPTELDEKGAPKKVFRQRLILPVEAFANSIDVMQKALKGLIDAGVVKRNPAISSADVFSSSSPSAEPTVPASSAPRSPNASTNFR